METPFWPLKCQESLGHCYAKRKLAFRLLILGCEALLRFDYLTLGSHGLHGLLVSWDLPVLALEL